MRELVEYIVKQLVSNPDAVVVEERAEPGMVNFLLTVDPADMGLIIGKAGQTIKAVRRLLTIRAIADNVRVNLELKEVGGEHKAKEESGSMSQESSEAQETSEEDAGQASMTDTPIESEESRNDTEETAKEDAPQEEAEPKE